MAARLLWQHGSYNWQHGSCKGRQTCAGWGLPVLVCHQLLHPPAERKRARGQGRGREEGREGEEGQEGEKEDEREGKREGKRERERGQRREGGEEGQCVSSTSQELLCLCPALPPFRLSLSFLIAPSIPYSDTLSMT
eukprot:2307948-Rhodomonas_salina.1